jgi:hypothetical protein
MEVGDIVLYRERRYVLRGVTWLRGFTRMGPPEPKAELEDEQSGVRIRVPLSEVEPLSDQEPPAP